MKLHRMDHVGIIVNDLDAAIAFFVDLGFEVQGRAQMDGDLLETVVALDGAKTDFAMVKLPDGEATIEIIKFITPADTSAVQHLPANRLGIRHLAFAVEDIEA